MRLKFTQKLRGTLYVVLCCSTFYLNAQTTDDYFGNGNVEGVSVSSSSSDAENIATNTLTGVIGGGSLDPEAEAARFLHQAAFGATYEEIQEVAAMGYEAWIDQQMEVDYQPFFYAAKDIFADLQGLILDPLNTKSWNRPHSQFTFYTKILKDEDQLRQKMAFALNQIFVVSFDNPDLAIQSDDLNAHYDNLYTNAFGNFRDILQEVTESQAMGVYLTYLANRKADPELGTTPDENYAREIMQLFTIGLWELNNDGTRKQDADGNDIPTYDIFDVQELAKVFTGYRVATDELRNLRFLNSLHDNEEKNILGNILPANNGYEDINDTLDILFNHDNTPPFICYRLIQQFVKSNPSPAYVDRVARIFQNNGTGVRGDLAAVIKAILLDPEARDCGYTTQTSAGKLIQPIQRFTMLWKAFKVNTPSGRLYVDPVAAEAGKQKFLTAPSVFNFFEPGFAENQIVEPAGLVSPEFQIFDDVSTIEYVNWMETSIKELPFPNLTSSSNLGRILQPNVDDAPFYDFSYEENLYDTEGIGALVDHLNLLLCRNTMNEQSQSIIENAINNYADEISGYDANQAVKDAIFFTVTSSAFTILK